MKHILLAEDHPLVLLGIESLLRNYVQEVEVYRAQNFNATLNALEKRKFDLLVMDINIPQGDRVDMVDRVRLKQPDIPILICSSYDEKLYGISFLKAGANGYISKTAPNEEFKLALDLVMERKVYMSPSLFQSSFGRLINGKKTDNVLDVLSEKEFEIARLLMKGQSTKSIGEFINLSAPAVSNHKARIFEKLGVSNIIELNSYFDLHS